MGEVAAEGVAIPSPGAGDSSPGTAYPLLFEVYGTRAVRRRSLRLQVGIGVEMISLWSQFAGVPGGNCTLPDGTGIPCGGIGIGMF